MDTPTAPPEPTPDAAWAQIQAYARSLGYEIAARVLPPRVVQGGGLFLDAVPGIVPIQR